MNFYNENNPKAAAWIRELINLKLIPNGTVDTRSITDISPADLAGFTQCHFFAGLSGWSLALNLAGWPEDRPIWTGSCPCQPFSVAGKQLGKKDPRHLWPAFRRLIGRCNPPVVVGEQVAQKDGREWLVGVFTDLERLGYAPAGADLCAAGIGETGHPLTQESAAILRALAERTDISDALREQLLASAETVAGLLVGGPHIRSRLYWMAYAESERKGSIARGSRKRVLQPNGGSPTHSMANANGGRREQRDEGQRTVSESDQSGIVDRLADSGHGERGRQSIVGPAGENAPERHQEAIQLERCCGNCRLANTSSAGTGRNARTALATETECGGKRSSDGMRCSDESVAGCAACGMGDIQPGLEGHTGDGDHGDESRRQRAVATGPVATAGRASHWGDFDILPCLDGKARRVESGTFPLVAGLPGGVGHSSDPSAPITVQEANATPEGRVMRLHGYGNALCIPVAVEFIETVMEILP